MRGGRKGGGGEQAGVKRMGTSVGGNIGWGTIGDFAASLKVLELLSNRRKFLCNQVQLRHN